jgi:hypothetical protein
VQWGIGEKYVDHEIAADVGVNANAAAHVLLEACDPFQHYERPIPSVRKAASGPNKFFHRGRLERGRNERLDWMIHYRAGPTHLFQGTP